MICYLFLLLHLFNHDFFRTIQKVKLADIHTLHPENAVCSCYVEPTS